ncbi:NAD(P)-binding protein [Exidia glandulosa HHB12029]|uniref:NAD(P)-binding protein n=1 Tax=Exidia glandulosa HHB12029 TaxID=1314781 RepID=A0A165ELD3_EXIGL|nr:NAD(P)-binding protein [Exidia glandulosa HHB12029]
MVLYAALAAGSAAGVYLYLLSCRLTGTHGDARPERLTIDELDAVSYSDIDVLSTIHPQATGKSYVVVGGAGFVGSYLVRLLLKRGEKHVHILDRVPPPDDLACVPHSLVDITSSTDVQAAFASIRPDIVLHTAALIRFWERHDYTFALSHKVNVLGTNNLLAASIAVGAQVFVYCSTSDTCIPRPNFCRLSMRHHRVVIRDEDGELPPHILSQMCYVRSKLMAEELVVNADMPGGMRTGVLRPGFTILGPNDRMTTSTLTMPVVPVFDAAHSQKNVHVWDVAAAHIRYADLLSSGADDVLEQVAAQRFLVSGKGAAWTIGDIRRAIQHYAPHRIVLRPVPTLLIYLFAHLIEAGLWIRYKVLSPSTLVPAWLGELVFLQPATLEYFTDVAIDDTRARKLLGYEPQWTMAQSLRHGVDQVCGGDASFGTKSGLAAQSGIGHLRE